MFVVGTLEGGTSTSSDTGLFSRTRDVKELSHLGEMGGGGGATRPRE